MVNFLFIYIIEDKQGTYVSRDAYTDWKQCLEAARKYQKLFKDTVNEDEITIKPLTVKDKVGQ